MNDSTELYKPNFYLVSDERSISVSGRTVIGRSAGDYLISDKKLSTRHCELIPRGISLFIKDLKSTNGTYVNGIRLQEDEEKQLKLGDIIRLGSEDLKFQETAPELKKASEVTFKNVLKSIPRGWAITYVLATALNLLAGKTAVQPIPEELNFLRPMTRSLETDFSYFFDYIIVCLALFSSHAYLSMKYLKGSFFFKVTSFVAYFFFSFMIVIMLNPMTDSVHLYLNQRLTFFDPKTSAIIESASCSNPGLVQKKKAFLGHAQELKLEVGPENAVKVQQDVLRITKGFKPEIWACLE